MVELNPRPRRLNLFVQVTVAVISGAAAMYFIQTVQPGALLGKYSSIQSKAPPLTAHSAAPPAAASAPDPDVESNRFKAAPPAAVSMLLVPEPGGAEADIVSVGDDASGPAERGVQPRVGARNLEPETSGKGTPIVHLKPSAFHGRSAQVGGHGFEESALTAPQFTNERKSVSEPEAPSRTAPRFITYPRNLSDKPIPQKDLIVPSILHPETAPEKPFWDFERKSKAAFAGLIAVSGLAYLLLMLGSGAAFVKPKFEEK